MNRTTRYHKLCIILTNHGIFFFKVQQLKANLRSPSNPTTPRLSQKQDLIKTSSGSIFGKASPSTSVADIYQMAENEVRGNGNVPLEQMAKKTAHQYVIIVVCLFSFFLCLLLHCCSCCYCLVFYVVILFFPYF